MRKSSFFALKQTETEKEKKNGKYIDIFLDEFLEMMSKNGKEYIGFLICI